MPGIDPETYEAWFEKPVGRYADKGEKSLISRILRAKPGIQLLDAGCGTGHFAADLQERVAGLVALDVSYEMLEFAKREHRLHQLVQGDVEFLPFAKESFEAVMMITVLEFVKDPQRALKEAYRVLKPSGQLVVGVLNRRSPWGLLRKMRGLLGNAFWKRTRLFSRNEIVEQLSQAGFADIAQTSALFGSFVLLEGHKLPT